MKRKILGILMLLALVCFSPVIVNASPNGWESIKYTVELGDQQGLLLRYRGNKVLQTFTQEGIVYDDGDEIGTISIEVFFQTDIPAPIVEGHAVAKYIMELDEIGLVEGVMEASIIVDFTSGEQVQTMSGRFSGHGDINIRGTLKDLAGNPDIVVLEGYAK